MCALAFELRFELRFCELDVCRRHHNLSFDRSLALTMRIIQQDWTWGVVHSWKWIEFNFQRIAIVGVTSSRRDRYHGICQWIVMHKYFARWLQCCWTSIFPLWWIFHANKSMLCCDRLKCLLLNLMLLYYHCIDASEGKVSILIAVQKWMTFLGVSFFIFWWKGDDMNLLSQWANNWIQWIGEQEMESREKEKWRDFLEEYERG